MANFECKMNWCESPLKNNDPYLYPGLIPLQHNMSIYSSQLTIFIFIIFLLQTTLNDTLILTN